MFVAMAVLAMTMGTAGPQQPQKPSLDSFTSFEVATVKPVEHQDKAGRFFHLVGTGRWEAVNFTLKNLIALAYDLNPKTISGGPGWVESQEFTIEATLPEAAATKPTRAEQMTMLRALLVERFGLKFHRTPKEFSIYELSVAPGGPKLKAAAHPDDVPSIIGMVYPDKVEVPAKNISMDDFVAMLQRATLDRPVLNKTGLAGRYDFTLDFAQDETQYGGDLPKAPENAQSPPLFVALKEQLGLQLTPTRGMVDAMVVDGAQHPSVD